jgi:hypothetical protein
MILTIDQAEWKKIDSPVIKDISGKVYKEWHGILLVYAPTQEQLDSENS